MDINNPKFSAGDESWLNNYVNMEGIDKCCLTFP